MKISNAVTSGTFSLDGGTWDVDNNIWVVGDDAECIVIDAAHDDAAIMEVVGERKVRAILLTHAHDDHIGVAMKLKERTGAPIHLHPADRMLWDRVYPDQAPDQDVADGARFPIGGGELVAIHTPGHSPGSVCYYAASANTLFSGDTLFSGGPGATGRSFSSFDQIIDSIRDKLLTLPEETVVLTGHGDSTKIGDEAPHLDEWIARGH